MPAKKKTKKKTTEEVEPDPAFDAKSAEVADVGQQIEEEKQDSPAHTDGAAIGETYTDGAAIGKTDRERAEDAAPPGAPPPVGFIEQRLGELEDKFSNLRAGFDEFEELISKVGSDQHEVDLRLSEAMSVSVTEHHDRLLQLEMKVSRLTG